MKKVFKIIYLIFSIAFLFYIAIPAPAFPSQAPDTLKSVEPGDLEDSLRPSYFTDFDREESIEYYTQNFSKSPFLDIHLPTLRLNYPPEDAAVYIKELTRSTFLEELVHPFRESLFVNGFGAQEAKDAIVIGDRLWNLKLTIKYYQSSVFVRIPIAILTLLVLWRVLNEWGMVFLKLKKK